MTDRAAIRARNTAFVNDYKREHGCVDCGFDDPRALDFDHRDRTQKRDIVSILASHTYSLDRIKAEIAKCDVRCANCHRIRSSEERHAIPLEDWEKADPPPRYSRTHLVA